MPLAKINLNVTMFAVSSQNSDPTAPGFQSGFCTIDNPALVDNGALVSIDPGDASNILVKGSSPPVLEFSILPATGAFLTQQVKFVERRGSGDVDGSKDFTVVCSGNKATITNSRDQHGSGNAAPRWEFYIQITDSSGHYGWIDPGITNED